MRSYYIIILLLLTSLVLAQEVTITVSKITERTVSANHIFITSGGMFRQPPAPYKHNFGSPQEIRKITLHVKGDYCGWHCHAYAPTCLMLGNDSSTASCQASPRNREEKDLVFNFNPSRNADSITVSIGGLPEHASLTLVNFKAETTINPAQIKTSLPALRGSEAKDFGKVRERLTTEENETYFINTSNNKAPAWFSAAGGESSTNRTITPNQNDDIYACLNSDLNTFPEGHPKCDFLDEYSCALQDKDWYNGHCCHDAPFNPEAETPASECIWYTTKGTAVMNALCGKNADGKWKWTALDDRGLISTRDGGCPKIQVVPDGNKFYTCTDVPTWTNGIPANLVQRITARTTIEGHDYMCEGTTIAECGGDNPYSPDAKATGASITSNNQKYYCSKDGKWLASLDTSSESCTTAGLKWTGTKCCGETNDTIRTYEDPYTGAGTAGGCYNNQFVASGITLTGHKNIINYRGKFIICDMVREPGSNTTTTSQLFAGTSITPTTYGPCGTPLQQAILTGTKQHIICTLNNEWEFTSKTAPHLVKQTLWQPTEFDRKQGCCPENQCWDGQQCKDTGFYYDKIIGKGYRCE